jgi:hypothetical protein
MFAEPPAQNEAEPETVAEAVHVEQTPWKMQAAHSGWSMNGFRLPW